MRIRTWETRANGNIEVSILGLGGAPLGNMCRPIPETTAKAALDASAKARGWASTIGSLRASTRPT
jgi:hypothetical protein